jgi:Ca-activated chloride channel family protein
VSFLAPERLWLLAIVPVLAVAYVVMQRRRRRRAVRFASLELLRSVTPAHAAWRRHVPAAATALALAALLVGFARPSGTVRVPKDAATVMLVIDTSASMQAHDVEPSRIEAAIEAADVFVGDLPPQIEVGLVAFDQRARVLAAPTTDHAAVRAAIGALTLGPGTAAGDALVTAVDALTAANQPDQGAAVILLSDGVTTIGRPVVAAAEVAAERGIPVSTIAFGTDEGAVIVQGRTVPVPADPDTMAQVAEVTSGTFFEAVSAGDLKQVYEDIGTRVGYETEQRERSGSVVATGTVLLVAALGLGLLWNGRLV